MPVLDLCRQSSGPVVTHGDHHGAFDATLDNGDALVSKLRMGFFTSGAIGALIFFASYFLLGMRFMLGPVQTPITVIMLPVFGFVFGAAVSASVRIDSEN